jgi:HAD superfamily hydrolase (TIGR01490 family)
MMDDVDRGQPGAFFDLDHTLLTANSGRLWMNRDRREGRIGPLHVAAGLWFLALYRFGLVDIERAMNVALATIKGEREVVVRDWTRRWFDDEVVPHMAPGAQAFIAAHRACGHPVVLLTSSSPYASECAVEHFALDDFLSNRFEVEDGCFTGRIVKPICYGQGKIRYAEAYADEHGIDLDESWFYSDSTTDRPMLERVRHPMVVHPDPRLRRVAKRRAWPILDWHAVEPEGDTARALDTLRGLSA